MTTGKIAIAANALKCNVTAVTALKNEMRIFGLVLKEK